MSSLTVPSTRLFESILRRLKDRSTTKSLDVRELDLRLQIERLNLLYDQNIPGLTAMVVYSMSFTLMAWDHLPAAFLLPWAAALLSSGVIRVVATQRWRAARHFIKDPSEVRPWSNAIRIMLLISGTGWGLIGWMITPAAPAPLQILTALIIIFMSAGALACYSASLPAMLLVTMPAMLPWAVRLISWGDATTTLLGALAVLYLFLAVRVGKSLNRYVDSSLRLTLENARLAKDLRHQVAIEEKARQQLRESDARLRLSLDASGAASWSWSPLDDRLVIEGKVPTAVGGNGDRFTGTLNDFLSHVHPEDRERVREALESAARSRRGFDVEHRVLAVDKSLRQIALRGRYEVGTDRKSGRLSGVCWDVTALRAQEALRRDRDIHEAANKAKSTFLANASHEIRTPLSAINGFAELLIERLPSDVDAHEEAQAILRNGRYLVSLVNDLLDLSRIETGRLFVQKIAVDPRREIEESVLVVRSALDEKGLFLNLVYETELPESIDSDSTRLRQVLINLLNNAVKFTKAGGITIRVRCDRFDDRDSEFSASITDTGMGMGPRVQESLFQPFVRGQTPEVQKVIGAGLGLALSKHLSQLLGGDLELLRSAEGQGSEFRLVLRLPKERVICPTKTSSKSERTPAGERLNGMKVLVAEDMTDLQLLMRKALENHGATVTAVENGKKAVERALTEKFDVILMDIKMPVFDGYKATAELRANGYKRPVIALTAHASSEDKQRCLEAGFDDYLSKPVEIRPLVEKILSCNHNSSPQTIPPVAP